MSQLLKEYEGTWEEILTHSNELTGQTVRVMVMESEKELPLANQKMLAVLNEMDRTPWTPEELQFFDDFEKFQKERRDRFYSREDTP